jgi:hypothetical protein
MEGGERKPALHTSNAALLEACLKLVSETARVKAELAAAGQSGTRGPEDQALSRRAAEAKGRVEAFSTQVADVVVARARGWEAVWTVGAAATHTVATFQKALRSVLQAVDILLGATQDCERLGRIKALARAASSQGKALEETLELVAGTFPESKNAPEPADVSVLDGELETALESIQELRHTLLLLVKAATHRLAIRKPPARREEPARPLPESDEEASDSDDDGGSSDEEIDEARLREKTAAMPPPATRARSLHAIGVLKRVKAKLDGSGVTSGAAAAAVTATSTTGGVAAAAATQVSVDEQVDLLIQ